ncbi:peroxidase-related enzyme [Azospirillum sp. TSO22-1]|uniref:peroxidase-related enzyme n=1 Tax=Azospirillum sp. TSO22-1 TaxID=716789 RepID=UPI000D608F2E|nr:peroxidase-related enzyme [Azospirillum sp. TSO22-1]PWC53334.1 alkylhydroperoxidase [Azospirillum sp. TSO22-1]
MSVPATGFTLDVLEWEPWLAPVDYATATEAQRAALAETPSNTGLSPYSLMLAHDPEALRQRTPLFNGIMYAPRGLPRAERELATLVESVLNGCVYCASVHARRFAELTKEPEVVHRLYAEGAGTDLDPRRRAIVDFAAKLTATPPAAGPEDVAALRAAGLDDLQILDLIHAVAIFAWANRLMLTLGEPVRAAPG